MEERVRDVEQFWKNGLLNEESNVQFGEGGAGTFSDGKLTTGIKDPRIFKVLETFVSAGAQKEILYKHKASHWYGCIAEGSGNPPKRILAAGGEIRFESRLTDLILEDGRLKGVEINGRESLSTEHLILALGHSSRDTLHMLRNRSVPMEQKPFSIGVRVEHPQEWIDRAQYGDPKLAEILGARRLQAELALRKRKGRLYVLHVSRRRSHYGSLKKRTDGNKRHELQRKRRKICQQRAAGRCADLRFSFG